MSFFLGKQSLRELVGVHPYLAFAVMEAIKISKQDFMVLDGLRTQKEQEKLVARGVSKTNNSYHLYGLAVDLVAYVDGKPSWEEKYYTAIAEAMQSVIKRHNLPIEWGYDKWGWDLPHWQITHDPVSGADMRKLYDARGFIGTATV
ncbi:M15 family metallopeptidase [Sulfurimonas sp.]|uniref:M15 family metallopeptidase n=1 Tax=Sulfurimonas sp. TaxID=2022749 RepID=UPI00261003B7|nr:M15 family metallopeptidase [Sulfurimonas sp.]MDD3452580.1 M15 family metallopeptidase [Sulfurimonas sp.]